MKYRGKPVVIEAVKFQDNADSIAALQEFMGSDIRVSYENPEKPVLKIETLDGFMEASVGDYIIKSVNNEFYPCKPDVFAKIYEPEEEK